MRDAEAVCLPVLGKRFVTEIEPGHWLWLSAFGWHDCSVIEDNYLKEQAKKIPQKDR